MTRTVDLQVGFRVTLQDGATMFGRVVEIVETAGEKEKVIVDGAAVQWDCVAGIACVRVPVIRETRSMALSPQ